MLRYVVTVLSALQADHRGKLTIAVEIILKAAVMHKIRTMSL